MATAESETDERGKLHEKIPTVEKLLKFIQSRDSRLGLVLSVFLLFILVFTRFSSAYGGVFNLSFYELMKAFFMFLLLTTLFVIFFKAIDNSILPRIIVWYFTSLALLTVSAFWIQAILRTPAPFLIEARCFADLWSQGCPLGTPVAQTVMVAPQPEPQHAQEQVYYPPKRNNVYVQFAGSLSREDVKKVSLKLKNDGWNIQGADQGGERTAQAVGIHQVRYFHNDDKDLAEKLATSYNELATWKGFHQLAVAFVNGHESRVPVGLVEVWTSVD